MIKPHEPFQDGSKHAANEYCPTCHGHMDPSLWDSDGKLRPESQRSNAVASWNWSCPYCETRDPECHKADCKGFTPEAINLRELCGGQYFGKRQLDAADDHA